MFSSFNIINYIKDRFGHNYPHLKYFDFELKVYLYPNSNKKGKSGSKLLSPIKKIYKQVKPGYFKIKTSNHKPIIISKDHGNHHLSKMLRQAGFEIIPPPYVKPISKADKDIKNYSSLLKDRSGKGINSILSRDFIKIFYKYYNRLKEFYAKEQIKGVILPYDLPFNERITLDIFHELEKPSFIYLHGGIPTNYFTYRFNESDYLLVWGEEHKRNYIAGGFDPDKVKVVGHPYYSNYPDYENFQFELDNVLVLTKSLIGGQKTDDIVLQDSAMPILYLFYIEETLKKFGIKKARLRMHPSENHEFYLSNINTNFFEIDRLSLKESLQKSKLVIGPGSTIFLESLFYGVNYIIFEPLNDGISLSGHVLARPMEGSDPDIPVANSLGELENIISGKKAVNPNVLYKYIKKPFDISVVNDIINSYS